MGVCGVRRQEHAPAHQFPTGVVLAPPRRRELLDWAVAADAVIIEDDYDAEYRYDRAPVPALQTAAPDHVAYAGTTSKTLAPGHAPGLAGPSSPAARGPGGGQARRGPGQPRAAAAGAGPPDRHRRARAAHPRRPQAAAQPARRPARRAADAPARGAGAGRARGPASARHVPGPGPGRHRARRAHRAGRGPGSPAVVAPPAGRATRARAGLCGPHPRPAARGGPAHRAGPARALCALLSPPGRRARRARAGCRRRTAAGRA
jgi:hypothetical protein